MTMTPGVRKLALTAHVTSTVGWLGAVASFLALAIAGLTSQDVQMLRAAYVAMEVTGWYVIVPLCFASLITGLVQALGTPWGLFRHYWIAVKLLIAILSTILLLLHMRATSRLATAAADVVLSSADLGRLRMQLTADAAAALLALLVATTLAIYKPRGMTRYGARKEDQRTSGAPRWAKLLVAAIVLVLVALRLLTHPGGHSPSGG
jgi:ABC-type anion transport system duplicated permease subunit